MTEPSPDEWAIRARAGEPGAFDGLVRSTTVECYALAFRLTGNSSDASDVVQEAYLRAFRAIGRFRADASVRTWLYRIVANCASNVRRSRPATPTIAIDEAFEIADPRIDRDPSLVAERGAERAVVIEALRHLPFALRAVVVLRDIYDLPHDAIAAELGISRAAAKVRLHRARKALREALDPTGIPRHPGLDDVTTGELAVTVIGRSECPVGGVDGRARAV
jgi:RNA polymerase sigma-70 factor (ECF subfamily)